MTESHEQQELMKWARQASIKYKELELLHHIPNGGYRMHREAARLHREGVLSGIPDLFLPCARDGYHGLYIEMKRADGGRLSESQKNVIGKLIAQGYCVKVCHGWQEAAQLILDYMGD